MREAVGGSMLFYIVTIFLIIYIAFIGVVMNYASTYRASNYIVSKIEEYEADLDNDDLESLENIARENYYYDQGVAYCCKDNNNGSVYQVTTKVIFKVPLINVDLKINVRTETKTIYGISCSERQSVFRECQ